MYLMSDIVTVVKRVISLQGGTEIDKTKLQEQITFRKYEGWNFNSGNYLFTIDTK